MQTTARNNSDPLVLRQGMGCVCLFLFLMGTFVIASVFIPAKVRGGDEVPWYIGLPIGLGMIVLGTYRKNLTLDGDARVAETKKQILGYTYQQSRKSLDNFDRVELATRIRRSDNSSRTVFVVSLQGDASLELEEHAVVDPARHAAERVARYLHIALHDRSSGSLQVFDPDELGLSVRQRAEHSGRQESIPTVPEDLECHIDVSQAPMITVEVPAAGWSWSSLMTFLPTIAFGIFFVWLSYDGVLGKADIAERLMAIGTCGFGLLLSAGSIAGLLAAASRQWIVEASSDRIKLQSKSWLGGRTRTIDAEMIEEVIVQDPPQPGLSRRRSSRLSTSRGIAIRTRQKTFTFARHLPKSEQQFLARFLRATLEGAFSNT